jgi:phage-related protein
VVTRGWSREVYRRKPCPGGQGKFHEIKGGAYGIDVGRPGVGSHISTQLRNRKPQRTRDFFLDLHENVLQVRGNFKHVQLRHPV